jgi:ATP-binding cassette subfamily B protein
MTERLHATDQPEKMTVAQRNDHNAGLAKYSSRPIAFLYRYIRQHPLSHLAVLISVFTAVGCALASQYSAWAAATRNCSGPLFCCWSA